MPKSKKEKDNSKIFYLRTDSIEDVCRHASKFDFSSDPLVLVREKIANKIIALGEWIGETLIAYYANTKESGNMVVYEPASGIKFTTKTDAPTNNYIHVMRSNLANYSVAKDLDKKKVQLVKVEHLMDLIGAVIRKAAKEETIANIYSFQHQGKRVFAAFGIIDALADSKQVFYYSFSESDAKGTFARFDYRNNTLSFVDNVGEHNYLYAKIINLAEAFPFFKE